MNNETLNAYNYITTNAIVMNFVTRQAFDKIQRDVIAATGVELSADSVTKMIADDQTIAARFDQYLAAAVAVCVSSRLNN